jgi:hypothetical protein
MKNEKKNEKATRQEGAQQPKQLRHIPHTHKERKKDPQGALQPA